MANFGRHVIAEFYNIDPTYLDDPLFLKEIVKLAVHEAKMRLIRVDFERFTPQGITMVAILSESHLAIHTWPEKRCAAVDCFTCGEEGNPAEAILVLERLLEPKRVNKIEFIR